MSASVEALLPRLAKVTWQSVLQYGPGSETVAVLYSVPIIDGNDSLTYLELFTFHDKGPATPRDSIAFGGRDGYAIDTITEGEDKTLTLHAREHQYPDCLANPTKRVNIVVYWGQGVIRVSTIHPDDKSGERQ